MMAEETSQNTFQLVQRLVVPRQYFFGSGKGEAPHALAAFDRALLDAGIGDVNLVKLSSILPPDCKRITPFQLPFGALVPVAYASITCECPGAVIAASVAIAFPDDPQYPGIIMEFSGRVTAIEAETCVREMAEASMNFRGRKLSRIETMVSEHVVQNCGCVFAGIVLIP